MRVYDAIKWWLYPGINLHARQRFQVIGSNLRPPGNSDEGFVLDAGCGNGMLAYQAYRKGNRALGVSIKIGEVERNRRIFNHYLRIPESRLRFEVFNLYDLEGIDHRFDQIICSEVLEHISDDRRICQSFWQVLKPGGVLHLCCPNADHPDNANHELDSAEQGGHVRPGYTESSFRSLLEPIGFRIVGVIGLGGPIRQNLNRRIRHLENRFGLAPAVAFFLLVNWLTLFDHRVPRVPYCIYIQAEKVS